MEKLKAEWQRSCLSGQLCVLTEQPTRAMLNALSEQLVASFEPAWVNTSTGETGGPYFTVRKARSGLLGYWDRLWDAAQV